MSEVNPALYLQARSDHTAAGDRQLLTSLTHAGGVAGVGDLAVTQNSTPNMSVNVAAGAAFIPGTESSLQGSYHVWNDSTKNLAIAAADPTNGRIDRIVARVYDSEYSGGDDEWALEVITGTPAGSPSAPATPDNALSLATVSVPALASSVVTGDITDTRLRAAALGGEIVCTSTTRPSNPYPGQRIYETDTFRSMTYYGPTTGWQLPWNMPWGKVAALEASSNSSSISGAAADISGYSVSFTAVAGRQYRVVLGCEIGTTNGNEVYVIDITDSSNTSIGRVTGKAVQTSAAGIFGHALFTGSGSFTVKLRGSVVGGGSFQILSAAGRRAVMLIEDIGPAANPS